MSLIRAAGPSALLLAFCAAAAWADGPAVAAPACGPAGCTTCTTGACASCACRPWLCCPKHVFCLEKRPCIKWHCVCPKPICEPCDLEDFGYYPTCWHPWPYPPNYCYCPVPPPGVLAGQQPLIGGVPGPSEPGAKPDESLPPPKKTANPNPDR